MASTHKHIRSSTANKRPTTAIADGQIALNTNASSPGLFFKDSTGASIIKIGPVHVGSTAPNATPGAGGSSGNSTGEIWLDNSLTPVGVKIWNGSAWVNATPVGSTTVQGLLELATSAETQTGTDTDRAVTPAGLQSKLSDSTSTTSSTTIASSTAVKSAYDLANAALPKSGGTITGNLEIGTTGSLSFEGSTADAFETTIAVTDPTADRTITLPDTTGTVVTTGDTGTVTGTMILDGTIVDADINASAAIAHSKLANITAASVLLGNASNVPTATALTGDVTVTSSGVTSISSGVIVNADVNASAAIAGTKISPDFGSQNTTTTGTSTAASFIPTSSTVPTNGVYLPATNSVAISTNGANRFQIDSSGNITVDTNTFYVDAANNRVGVGTTSPGYPLHISSALDASLYIEEPGNNTVRLKAGTSASFIGTTSNHPFYFTTNNQERVRITSAGLVGIGTSSPQAVLESKTANVQPGDAAYAKKSVVANIPYSTSNVTSSALAVYDGTIHAADIGYSYDGTGYYLTLGTNDDTVGSPTERLRIDRQGRVGIGTTAPQNPLVVSNGGANGFEISSATNSGTTSYLLSYNRSTSAYTDLRFDASAFRFEVSASEKARIDSSGRLLVGTSSARTLVDTSAIQFETVTDNFNNGVSLINYSLNGYYPVLRLALSRTNTQGGQGTPNVGTGLGAISFTGSDGTTFRETAAIVAAADAAWGSGDAPGRLVFSTTADGASTPTERMRITSAGRVNVISTEAGIISETTQGSGTTYVTFQGRYGATSGSPLSGVASFQVYSNGNVQNSNNSYGSISDLKLKENIVNASSQWDDLKALQVRNYNFKEGQTHTQIGLVAQEVELVSPGLVSESPDRDEDGNDLGTVTKSVNYSVLYMKAVKALQEAMERIETLEQRLNDAGIN